MSLKIGGIDIGATEVIFTICYPVFELETKLVETITKTLYSPTGGPFVK